MRNLRESHLGNTPANGGGALASHANILMAKKKAQEPTLAFQVGYYALFGRKARQLFVRIYKFSAACESTPAQELLGMNIL